MRRISLYTFADEDVGNANNYAIKAKEARTYHFVRTTLRSLVTRFETWNRKKKTVAQFVTRVVKDCDFGNQADQQIRLEKLHAWTR